VSEAGGSAIAHDLAELPTILDELETSIQRRGLQIAAVDAQGHVLRWEDPAVIDVRCIASGFLPITFTFWVERTAYIQYGYTLRAVLRAVVPDPSEELEHEVRTHIIAGGRRHVMKGDL
jgi:hypothetical protein